DGQLVIDSSKIEVRKPAESSIVKFKSDKEFIYNEAQPQNWWDAFWAWVGSKLSKLMGKKAFGFFQEYLGYIIILAAVIIITLVLNKSKLRGLFYFSKESKIPGFKEIKEDINEINFDNLITEAVSESDFRIAVRLYYLKTLKLLSDRKLIDWKINKTNQNYVREIKEEKLKKHFEKLTYLFEWIWYGEMPIAESVFEETKNSFMNFQNSLQTER
ncbi:MAG: hypothetical protein WBV81_12250, partial [Ignavibacteriaceae bacterium]